LGKNLKKLGSNHVFDQLFLEGGHYCPDSNGRYSTVTGNNPEAAFPWSQTSSNAPS